MKILGCIVLGCLFCARLTGSFGKGSRVLAPSSGARGTQWRVPVSCKHVGGSQGGEYRITDWPNHQLSVPIKYTSKNNKL